MDKIRIKVIELSRKYRDLMFSKVAKFLLKLGISAKIMTTLSLFSGVGAAYFLFDNYILFSIFIILHLIADSLDGVIARLEEKNKGKSKNGIYWDYFTDRLVALSLLLKIATFTRDYYVYIIITISLLAQTIYLLSNFKYPILFSRTALVIILLFYPFIKIVPIIAYLTVGVLSLYALTLQFSYYLKLRFN